MTADNRLVLLGHVSTAHGLRGEVLIKTYTGEPKAIGAYGALVDETGTRRFDVKVVRVTDKGVIARIGGVGDRNAAEAIKGTKLYVARAQLPAATEGEYYHADLIGLDAVSETGEKVGHVVAVQNFGASDLLEIRLEGSIKTEFIPFTDACVPTVDIVGRRVVVSRPEMIEGGDAEDDGSADDEGSGGPADERQDPPSRE